jgi:hypothetical protein
MKKSNIKKLQKECDNFNKKYPVGTEVMLKKDFVDKLFKTKVKIKAHIMCNDAVAFFDGVSGAYTISCVKGVVNETNIDKKM